MDLSYLYNNYLEPIFGIIGGIVTLYVILQGSRRVIKNYYASKIDYWERSEVREYEKYYISTQCQDVSPGEFNEPGDSIGYINRVDLIDFFMEDAFVSRRKVNKFYLILGDAGMGKTTFLINLYLKYYRKKSLFKKNIVLIPFGRNDTNSEIQNKVPARNQSGTILLLDAFDEDPEAYENPQRLQQILKWTERFYKVIITCRTNFFSNLESEPLITDITRMSGSREPYDFIKKYISPFSDGEVEQYIRKRFSWFRFQSRSRSRKIIKMCPNLMVRPLLLSYINYLVHTEKDLNTISLIYQELISQ